MLELIKRNYWWPGIKGDIKKYKIHLRIYKMLTKKDTAHKKS